MSDITAAERAKIYSAAISINRSGKYGVFAEIGHEMAAAQLGIEALKASGWEIVPAGALSTAREEGRLEGLEEAAKYVDEAGSRNADASNNLYAEGNRDAARLSSFVSRSLYDVATAIRALKEKQP